MSAAAIAVLLGAAAVFYSPPVQHWLVARIIDPGPDTELTVDRARVGFSRISLTSLELRQPHLHYRAGSIRADLSLREVLFRGRFNIGNLHIADLEIDLTPDGTPPEREPFGGILPGLDFPDGLSIGKARIDGRVLLPRAKNAPADLTFEGTGNGIAPGAEGTIRIDARFQNPSGKAPVNDCKIQVTASVRQDSRGRFDRVSAGAIAIPGQNPGRESREIFAEIRVERTDDGETSSWRIDFAEDHNTPPTRIVADSTFSYSTRAFEDSSVELFVDDQSVGIARGRISLPDRAVQLSLATELPALFDQPLVAGRHRLIEGNVNAEVDARFRDPGFIDASLIFHDGLIDGDEGPETLFPATLRIRAHQTAKNEWALRLTLRIERPDLPGEIILEGKIVPGEPTARADLRLAGERFIVTDLRDLLDAVSTPGREEGEARHDAPFWNGFSGRVLVDLDALHFGDGLSVSRIDGSLTFDEDKFGGKLRATFLGGRTEVEAWLNYVEADERPYRIDGYIKAAMVDLGALFRNWVPDRPPLVEGSIDARGQFSGDGANPSELLGRLRGELDMRGKNGTFHLFHTDSLRAKIGLTVGGILGILGSEPGTINEIASRLGAIQYDELEARFERGERYDLELSYFRLLAPEFHLRGTGAVKYEKETDFTDQPLNLDLELAVRGEMEDLLDRAAVLSDDRDELDYRKLYTSFPIGGSVGDLDLSPFFHVLSDAAFGLALPFAGRIDREKDKPEEPSGDDR